MKVIEVSVEDNGLLRIPSDASLPSHTRLAVLVLEPGELNGAQISSLAQASGAFDSLKEGPEIYSDADILPGRANRRFRK